MKRFVLVYIIDPMSQSILTTIEFHTTLANLNLFAFPSSRTHDQNQKTLNTMRFTAISLLYLAAAAVDAAAVTKRDCIEFPGNSWGCDPPAGQPQNWNYCQVVNPNYPVHMSPYSHKRL